MSIDSSINSNTTFRLFPAFRSLILVVTAGCIVFIMPCLAAAEVTVDQKLPLYKPGAPVNGEIVCGGNHATDEIMGRWAKTIS